MLEESEKRLGYSGIDYKLEETEKRPELGIRGGRNWGGE